MDILSEEEVSYYKKSLISQEGSIKKKVRQETHQLLQNQHCGA